MIKNTSKSIYPVIAKRVEDYRTLLPNISEPELSDMLIADGFSADAIKLWFRATSPWFINRYNIPSTNNPMRVNLPAEDGSLITVVPLA